MGKGKQRFFWVLASFSLSQRPLAGILLRSSLGKTQNSALPHGYSFSSNALLGIKVVIMWKNQEDVPIKIPARKTNAPPSRTCNSADTSGVSMNRCLIHEMTHNSTITTPTAT